MYTTEQRRHPPSGPELRYTNEGAREVERQVENFTAATNRDLHALLTWAADLRRDIAALLWAGDCLRAQVTGEARPAGPEYAKNRVLAWDAAVKAVEGEGPWPPLPNDTGENG